MRFVKVAVESFQAILRADVEFGPGLNVLYGPNDLGKSTLGAAIRAALLVPPTSSEAAQFASWYADATPRVSLTFVDDVGHYWKVSKGFGDGAHTGSELMHSKDGASFVLDCKARQVEEKIRALLGWGIPAPGGKGAPRGVPSTFLANALLATQTDVDAILEASLANDPEPSGKVRLSKALATLAQDPLFKKVLDAAQHEVDQCFTRTGQRSRAQTSRFAEAASAIKGFQKEREALQRQVVESSAIEESVGVLRERRARALMRAAEAARTLSATRERLARTRARDEVQARLTAARTALEEVDAFARRVAAMDVDVGALSGQVNARQTELAAAIAECDAAAAAVANADEAHRRATSEGGVRERELRRAQLAEQAAGLSATRQGVENRKVRVNAALQARTDAVAARDVAVGARTELERLNRELGENRDRATAVERELELARATLAYGRLRAAASSADSAAKAKENAGAARSEAERKGAESRTLEAQAGAAEETLAKRQAALPTEEVAEDLELIERELEIAEAALGGGLSVVVRPKAAVQLRAFVDQRDTVNEESLTTERVIDAERTVRLTVGDLVDIEVTAGAADKRRTVESLRTRASTEIGPLLYRAGLQSLREVRRELEALARERASTVELRKRAAQLQVDAEADRDRALVQEEQAATLYVSPDDLEARRAAIGATELQTLESSLAKLGKAWEAQADAAHQRKTNEFKAAQTGVTTTEQAAKLKEYQVSDAEGRAAEAAATAEASLAVLQSSDPDALLRSIDGELASLARNEDDIAAALASLAAEASGQVENTKQACDSARQRAQAGKDVSARAAAALEEARAALNARIGERGALRAQLDTLDRVGAAANVEERERELAALPTEPAVTDAEVTRAEREVSDANRELDEAKEELHKSEGALSKVGGAAIREEVERVQEALTLATVREKALEVDADAWKLLRDTLRDVENEEGAHLGRALAGPVAARFVELTGGRYRDLRLDATLRTEAVAVGATATGGSEVLAALSVGTRGQLATLIRLTVAEQLKSAIVLDDHLVHTDPKRLAWFRDVLTRTALNTQVVVLTCRPEDYLAPSELAATPPIHEVAGGTIRAIDAGRLIKRYAGVLAQAAPQAVTEGGTQAETLALRNSQ